MKKLLVFTAVLALAGGALAQDVMKLHEAMIFQVDTPLTWAESPAFEKGAVSARLIGDRTKPELFIARQKLPPRYKIAPHYHTASETVTVLSGSMWHGLGEKFDTQKGELMKAGAVLALPAKHVHYVWTTEEGALLQIQAIGPIDIIYVDPADDPRKKGK